MAIGEIGMSIKEFYSLTYIEYHYVAKYYMMKDERDWQRMRLQTSFLINLQMEKDKSIKPEDLFSLPSDKIIKVKKDLPTKEEMLEIAEKYRKE